MSLLEAGKHKHWLIAVGILSLFITYLSNSIFARTLPHIPGIGASCVASVISAMAIYIAVRPSHVFALALPSTPWRRVVKLSIVWIVLWLVAATTAALMRGSWHAYAVGSLAILGFVLLGPLTEEFLFRGAIFELAERSYPANAWAPVMLSTILFSAYHLQLHGFKITPFVVLQLAFTLPMGIVFATLRHWSGSLWPGFVLHVLTNLPHAFGAPPLS